MTRIAMYLSLIAEKNPEVFTEIRGDVEMKYKYPGLMKVFAADVAEDVQRERREQEQETLVTWSCILWSEPRRGGTLRPSAAVRLACLRERWGKV